MAGKSNTEKTKAQLISEIGQLRREISELKNGTKKTFRPDIYSITETDMKSYMHLGVWYMTIPSGKFSISSEISHILCKSGRKGCRTYKDYLNSIHPDDRKALKDGVAQILEDQKSFTRSVRHVVSKNTSIQTVTQVHYLETGKKSALLTGFILDITQFQKATSTLEQENNRYRQLFELSPTGIILEDKNGLILDVNPSFCRSLGYVKSELSKENLEEILELRINLECSLVSCPL